MKPSPSYDILIVGSGLFGATFANQALSHGLRVLTIDKRPNVAGNCFSENTQGIEVHKYGPHIFHTSDTNVWEYVNRFSPFLPYVHRPLARVGSHAYSFPINLETIRTFHPEVCDEEGARQLLASFASSKNPANFEEFLLGRVGEKLYHAFYRGYSQKQWGRNPRDLPAFIARRVPIRTNSCDRYFSDLHEGIPTLGYTALIQNMFLGIEVRTNTDYFTDKAYFDSLASSVIYTGEIDRFFGHKFGYLEYRSLAFEESLLERDNFQDRAIVNYCDADVPYTRITEHKHFTGNSSPVTIITREYPGRGGESFYPLNDATNNALYRRYAALGAREAHVIFGGRLAEYKYFDMDHAISSAMRKFETFKRNGFQKIAV